MTYRSGDPRHLEGCFSVSVTAPSLFHYIRPLLFHIDLVLADISVFPRVGLLDFTPFFCLSVSAARYRLKMAAQVR